MTLSVSLPSLCGVLSKREILFKYDRYPSLLRSSEYSRIHAQLALALARLFNGQHDYSFHLPDQQALCSLITFILGASIARIGDKIGCKTRAWLSLGTFIQTLFTAAAAIAIWKSGQASVSDARANPAWNNTLSFVCIGFMSASMGLQGIMGKRTNTQFTTTGEFSHSRLFYWYSTLIVPCSGTDDDLVRIDG